MKKFSLPSLALLCVMASFSLGKSSVAQSVASLSPMLKEVTQSVVHIAVEKGGRPSLENRAKGKKNEEHLSVGSGIIINAKDGIIITNAHVVDHAKVIVVTLKNGKHYYGDLIGEDEGFDIALLHIRAHDLTEIKFANSNQLEVGDFVAAIGSPFGLSQTATSGVISALNRSEPKIEGYQSFIQTDAPINPGNSGGALVNLKGELVGVNTAIISPSKGSIGLGFAIPSNMVKSIAEQLLKHGKVERGMLGIISQNISESLASALKLKHKTGVIVTKVQPGSPAEKAGIRFKDIVESINGEPINNAVTMRNTLGMMRPGTDIDVLINRNHKKIKIHTQVGNPKAPLHQKKNILSGLRLESFSELSTAGKLIKGVLITNVLSNSQAMLSDLRPGDIITRANTKPVNRIEMLQTVASHTQGPLLLYIVRGEGGLFVVLDSGN
jgi:serine protease Do